MEDEVYKIDKYKIDKLCAHYIEEYCEKAILHKIDDMLDKGMSINDIHISILSFFLKILKNNNINFLTIFYTERFLKKLIDIKLLRRIKI